jgi:glycosyltransferase involved in cell wall biosynthesis
VRALIDARPALDPRRTGVGVYTDRLLRALPGADPEGRYGAWYLHARGAIRPRRFFADVAGLREFSSRVPARVFGPLSVRTGWPRVTVPAEVFLATNFTAPPIASGARPVLVVHDVAFIRHPETAPHLSARWRAVFERQLREAPAVITPSAATRDDLVSAFDLDGAHIHVVPLGVDPFTPPPLGDVERVTERFAIGGSYALFVGGLEPRKNLIALVRAFADAAPADGWLVIGGGPVAWFPEAADDLERVIAALPPPIRRRIVRTGYLADEDKRALLAGAAFLAYPSLAEGFGLPVLEAFAAGSPVLTSNVSSLPEVSGDAALTVDPSVEGIASGLAALFTDEALRERLAAAGRERVHAYPWESTARGTAAVLHEAARVGL